MVLSVEKLQELFPSPAVKTWNGGVWPPLALRKRWQELHVAALAGSSASAGPSASFGSMGAPAVAELARAVADWALRHEIMRGIGL